MDRKSEGAPAMGTESASSLRGPWLGTRTRGGLWGWSWAPELLDQVAPGGFNVPGPVLFQGANPTKVKSQSWPGPRKSQTLTVGQIFWARSFVFMFVSIFFINDVDKTVVQQVIVGKRHF